MQELEPARARGDRDPEQEREARRRRAVEPAEEARRDRDPRARRPRDQRDRLRAADGEPLRPGEALERIAGRGRRRRRAPVGEPHDDAPHGGGGGDQERRAQMRLDELAQEHPREPARQRRDQHEGREPARQRAGGQRQEFAPKVGEERGERAEVERRVHGEPLIGPAEHVRDQDQMAGGRDGEELGEPLDDAEHDGLEVRHWAMARAAAITGAL